MTENATTAARVERLVGRLREWASGPACLNPENADQINLLAKAAEELERLTKGADLLRHIASLRNDCPFGCSPNRHTCGLQYWE